MTNNKTHIYNKKCRLIWQNQWAGVVRRSGSAGNTSRDLSHPRTTRWCLHHFTWPYVTPRKDSWHSGRLKSDRRFINRDLHRVQIEGKSAKVVDVVVLRHLRYLGGGDAGGESIGGISMIVEGHKDTDTGGVEGVCMVRRKKETKARQERRKKMATPDGGQKYVDSVGGGGSSGGGGGAAVRQETTTLSVGRSSIHTCVHVFVWATAQIPRNSVLKQTSSVPYDCSGLNTASLTFTADFLILSMLRLNLTLQLLCCLPSTAVR